MAALNRPREATYEVHEKMEVDTADNEDHTFCGIMFPIRAKAVLPVEKVVVHSVAVRGQLGNITIWVTNEDESPDPLGVYRIRLTARHWTKIYEQAHPPSQRDYEEMDLSENPIVLRPGQIRGIYIHSTLPGDEAIVYDNSDARSTDTTPRYEDSMVAMYSGKAHLSPTAFGQMPIWGWGNAWRDRREFVGQVKYGAVYKLWNPELHNSFGGNFQKVTRTLLALQRRRESPFSVLPDECLFYILNLCRWDWFNDNAPALKAQHRARKQKLRRQRIQTVRETQGNQQPLAAPVAAVAAAAAPNGLAQAVVEEVERRHQEGASSAAEHAAADDSGANHVNEESEADTAGDSDNDNENGADHADGATNDNVAVLDIDSDDDSDGGDSNESEWERTNGYRADTTAFSYRYLSSDDEREQADSEPPFYAGLLARAWVVRRALGQGRNEDDAHQMEEDSDDV